MTAQTFEAGGETWTFEAPKMGPLILELLDAEKAASEGDQMGMVRLFRSLLDWLGAGMGDEQAERLIGRLKDPNDELDLPEVAAEARGLIEGAVGRPTQPPSD